ncbi:MAG: hypothetical protein J3R72DRAFT_488597 [Linnemannia gamsii]|nr:MAG: hypothetical protein J3R72DRAFT_488597 [Linnemannia gamsii]
MLIHDCNNTTPQQQQQEEQQKPTRTNSRFQHQSQDIVTSSSNVERALRIPEIVIEICNHLTVSDLTECLSVSKIWNTIAQDHLWRSVFVYQRSEEFFVSLTSEQHTTLRQNAHRIKTFGLTPCETVFVNCSIEKEEEARCTQLEEIYFFGLVNRNEEIVDEEHARSYNEQPLALDLIAQNPRLLSIHLFDIEVMARLWTPTRLSQLQHHPSLQSITLIFANSIHDIYIIRDIGTHCPDTVQELKITTIGGSILQPSTVQGQEEEGIKDKEINIWRSLPQMRDLTIEISLHPCEESILYPLLRSCPNLTSLCLNTAYEGEWMESLMRILTQQQGVPFQNSLVELELPNILLYPAVGVQLMETFCGLTSLTMRVYGDGYTEVVSKMIQSSGATLENLWLIESTFVSRSCYAVGIDPILEGCSRLQVLRVDVRGTIPGAGVTMDRLLLKANNNNSWACKDTLEELTFRIDNPRGGDMDLWSYERGVLLVLRLFEKLMTLPRLRKVNFKWGELWSAIPYETGSKCLRAVSGSKMTMNDVRWMGLYWE